MTLKVCKNNGVDDKSDKLGKSDGDHSCLDKSVRVWTKVT